MPPTTDTLSASDSWLRMSLALAFVIGLVLLSAWLMKKLSAGRLFPGQSLQSDMKIVARTTLGEKRYLMVVEIQKKFLLLGVTPQSVNLITELEHFQAQDEVKVSVFERIFRSAGKQIDGGKK